MNRKEKIFGVGNNDTPIGWSGLSPWHQRVYRLWTAMIYRCYSPIAHERFPTYKGVQVCDRWLSLSKFAEDIKTLEGYQEWLTGEQRYSLDKDLKGKGLRIYSPDTCCFISQSCNSKERLLRNPHKVPTRAVVRISTNEEVKEYKSISSTKQDGFHSGNVTSCCKGKLKAYKGYKWMYLEDYNKLQANT